MKDLRLQCVFNDRTSALRGVGSKRKLEVRLWMDTCVDLMQCYDLTMTFELSTIFPWPWPLAEAADWRVLGSLIWHLLLQNSGSHKIFFAFHVIMNCWIRSINERLINSLIFSILSEKHNPATCFVNVYPCRPSNAEHVESLETGRWQKISVSHSVPPHLNSDRLENWNPQDLFVSTPRTILRELPETLPISHSASDLLCLFWTH